MLEWAVNGMESSVPAVPLLATVGNDSTGAWLQNGRTAECQTGTGVAVLRQPVGTMSCWYIGTRYVAPNHCQKVVRSRGD